jgi:hypothetical protein
MANGSETGLILALLVVLVVIVAYLVWRRWRRGGARNRFTLATPAAPRAFDAAAELHAGLLRTAALARSFEGQAAQAVLARKAEGGAELAPIEGARQGVAAMAAAIDGAKARLCGAPPTYANYLAVYNGLSGSDVAILNAADAFADAGHELSQSVARAPAPARAELGDVVSLANTLHALGGQMRRDVALVHRLGVALDAE